MTAPFSTAVVEAELRWGNLDTELEARVLAATQKAAKAAQRYMDRVVLAAKAKVTIDQTQLNRDLKDAVKAAALTAPPIKLNADVRARLVGLAEFKADARTKLGKLTGLSVGVEGRLINLSEFKRDAQTRLDTITGLTVDVGLRLASGAVSLFRSNVRMEFAAAGIINADIGLRVTAAEVNRFKLELRTRLQTPPPTVNVNLALGDTAAYRAALAAATRPVNQNVNVDRNGGGLGGLVSGAAKLGAVTAAIAAIGGAAGVALGAVGALGVGIAGLAVAGGAIGATLAVGLNGVKDAFSALGAASDSAGADAEAQATAIASATKQVASAEKDVQRAKKDSRTAETDLTRARKDAAQQITDLNLALKGGVISEKEAVFDLRDAQRELAKGDFGDDPDGRAKAILRVEKAQQRLEEAQNSNNQLAAKTDDANKKGVEGSDLVVAAKDRVAEASERVADAQTAAAEAQAALAKASSSSSAAADKAAQALAKLSPNARAFVLAMRDLKPLTSDLKNTVQDNLFAGLASSFTTMAQTVLPAVKDGLGTVATSLNGLAQNFASFWSQAGNADALKTALSGVGGFITGLGPGLAQMTTGFLSLGQAFAPVAEQVGASLGGLLGQIGQAFTTAFGNGQLTQLFSTFATILDGLGPGLNALITGFITIGNTVGPVIGPLFKSLGETFAAIAPTLGQLGLAFGQALLPVLPVLANLFNSIGQAVLPIIEPLSKVAVILGETLAKSIDAIAPAIGPLAEAFGTILNAVAPIIPLVAEIIAQFVEALAPALTTIFEALTPVISQLVEELQPVFEAIAPVLAKVAGIFADAMAQAITALAPLLPPLFEAFGKLVEALLPLIPPLLQIGLQLLPPLVDILGAILPVVTTVIGIFTDLVNFLMPVLVPAIETIGKVFGTVFGAVGDVVELGMGVAKAGLDLFKEGFQKVADFLSPAVEAMGKVFTTLGDTIKSVWDGITKAIAIAVKAIGKILQKVEIPDWFPGPLAGKGLGTVGDALVTWGEAHGAATGGIATGAGRIIRRAGGGRLIGGPGDGKSDSILAMLGGNPIALSNREFISTEQAYKNGAPLLWALNNGWVPDPAFLSGMFGGGIPGFAGGGLLEPWPGEENLKPPAVVARRMIHKFWPSITDIGGYRADGGGYNDHPSGRALDIMTSDVSTGNQINDWLHANKDALGLNYTIYRQTYKSSDGSSNLMEDRGSPTANHMDHIHALFNPSDVNVNEIPAGVSIPSGAANTAAGPDTRTENQKIVDAIVAEGQAQGASPQDIQAAIATNLVEAEGGNPDHGPDGSVGSFQQRDFDEWTKGGTRDRMNPTDAARSFFEHYKQTDPSKTPGERAQEVQRSAYPDKYDQRMGDAAKLYEESIARGKSSSSSSSSSSTSASGDGQKVFVTNWPSSSSSLSSPLSSSAPSSVSSSPSMSSMSTSASSAIDGGWGGPWSMPTVDSFNNANQWAAQQDFAGQASSWAQDALKSITGEFTDMFGLRSLSDRGIDSAFTAARQASEIKVADTVNFYGVNDPNAIADANARMLRDRMNPVTNTYRNG